MSRSSNCVLKILRLELENHAAILAGTGKNKIILDFTKSTSRINVFIGKMGSGKTYILSHLQPFAMVGTLDIRNSDDPIVEGKDGLKIIVYQKGNHEYYIMHKYLWSNHSHSKKSFIMKDGIELNPNGNVSSFNDIIQLEFGIDQSFLRLVRIGPNVVNFINMKATERKNFVASLLKDTETYLTLYKYWSNDLKTINNKVSILMNKINTFSNKPLDELEEDLSFLEDDYKDLQSTIDSLKQKKYELSAESTVYLEGLDNVSFINKITECKEEYSSISNTIDELILEMSSLDNYPDVNEISRKIGEYDSKLKMNEELLVQIGKEYEDCNIELNGFLNKKAIIDDGNHIDVLQESYFELTSKLDKYNKELRNFDCPFSSNQLVSLLNDIENINMMITDVIQYDKESIERIYSSDSSVVKFARDKIDILEATKNKIQQTMSNLTFAEKYSSTQLLFRPPFCPTKSCPYYVSHPDTLRKNSKGKVNDEIINYQNQLKGLEIEIYKYSDYPILFSKLSSLKEYWKRVIPLLDKISALREDSLKKVLLYNNYQKWYDYDKIIDTIDLIEKKNQYYEITERIKNIKIELNNLDISKLKDIESNIERLTNLKIELELKNQAIQQEKSKNTDKLSEYNQIYVSISLRAETELKLKTLSEKKNKLHDNISRMSHNSELISMNNSKIITINQQIVEKTNNWRAMGNKIDALRASINDVKFTMKELDNLLIEQKYLTYMVDAVSAKKGIPMKMVEVFFNSCRETINDMLYMVTEDELELMEFNIGEKEFTIPYSINGTVIDDISKASQGQTSLVSTALSFALVKELGSRSSSGDGTGYYPIPLLDEPDAALHKKDKPKLISILMKYLDDINSEQCFVITHNENTFDGYDVQIIMTTDEFINEDRYENAIHV